MSLSNKQLVAVRVFEGWIRDTSLPFYAHRTGSLTRGLHRGEPAVGWSFPFSSRKTSFFPSGVTAAEERQAYIPTSAGETGWRVRVQSRLGQSNQEI